MKIRGIMGHRCYEHRLTPIGMEVPTMPLTESIPFGFCHCGCGEKTIISPRTRGSRGNIKGQPLFFVNGHNATNRRDIEDAIPFKIEGVYCRLIPLTQGQYAIVWESDYAWLMQWRWQAKKKTNGYYACRSVRKDGKVRYVGMHRQILGMDDNDSRFGDHVDPEATIDNRRSNLRPANHRESQCNRRIPKNNKWGCKGISKGRGNQLRIHVYVDGKGILVGTTESLEIAKQMYRDGILKHHGEFARF